MGLKRILGEKELETLQGLWSRRWTSSFFLLGNIRYNNSTENCFQTTRKKKKMPSKTFKSLSDFIQNKMRMSHIYQPAMLIELLKGSGKSKAKQIAKKFLQYDFSQIEYYEQVTKNMPAKVLKGHGWVEKKDKEYYLTGFEKLSDLEVKELIELCQVKLKKYLDDHGERAFAHRRKSAGYIPGTIRYEVLKRAKSRCELCGIHDKEKALEVDHIIPRNKGGFDDITNFQALCYSCNSMKSDRDDTDFREVVASYKNRDDSCPFCNFKKPDIIDSEELAITVRDRYPVTPLHSLIIPRRHIESYFELGRPEVNACNLLLERQKKLILEKDSEVTGFNIGINDGDAAGQTVMHCHIHLIPRRNGDMDDPAGGVRGVIPEKQKY